MQTGLNLPTTVWVAPAKIFSGDLAFSFTSSVGEPRINANLLVNSPRFGPIGVSATDANTALSDLFVQSLLDGRLEIFIGRLAFGIITSGT